MARFFDVGQQAEGVIAIGQIATGVIAIGQVATGVIAIGQAARGVIAVGMGALGLVAIGMGAVGVVWASGFGLGGRKGFGLILQLMPGSQTRPAYPQTVGLDALASPGSHGWVAMELARVGTSHGDGRDLGFTHAGRPVDVRLVRGLSDAALRHVRDGRRRVLARLENRDGALRCTRLMEVVPPRWQRPSFWLLTLVRLVLTVAAVFLLWYVALLPLGDALFGPGGILR